MLVDPDAMYFIGIVDDGRDVLLRQRPDGVVQRWGRCAWLTLPEGRPPHALYSYDLGYRFASVDDARAIVALDLPESVIFMKAGQHAGLGKQTGTNESFDDIVARKREEERLAGVAYWGYGGTTCRPERVMELVVRATGPVEVFMLFTRARFTGHAREAREASPDGHTWGPLPTHVRTGGEFALVLSNLRRVDEPERGAQFVDLGQYVVGVGPSQGRPLPTYLRYHVDKACARLTDTPSEPDIWPVCLRATLAQPYAVCLRA